MSKVPRDEWLFEFSFKLLFCKIEQPIVVQDVTVKSSKTGVHFVVGNCGDFAG